MWIIYIHLFRARNTPEARENIGGLEEPILALIAHGSETQRVTLSYILHTRTSGAYLLGLI